MRNGQQLQISPDPLFQYMRTYRHILELGQDDTLDQGISLWVDGTGGFVNDEYLATANQRSD